MNTMIDVDVKPAEEATQIPAWDQEMSKFAADIERGKRFSGCDLFDLYVFTKETLDKWFEANNIPNNIRLLIGNMVTTYACYNQTVMPRKEHFDGWGAALVGMTFTQTLALISEVQTEMGGIEKSTLPQDAPIQVELTRMSNRKPAAVPAD